jgi:hypothetical protein
LARLSLCCLSSVYPAGISDGCRFRLYAAREAFQASSLIAMYRVTKALKGLHKLYYSIVCAHEMTRLQVIPALECAIASFMFVLDVWRVALDAKSPYTIGGCRLSGGEVVWPVFRWIDGGGRERCFVG